MLVTYLCNLFYIYNIFGIISIRAYNLCTPCYLQKENRIYKYTGMCKNETEKIQLLTIMYTSLCSKLQKQQSDIIEGSVNILAMAALLASSVYLTPNPTG